MVIEVESEPAQTEPAAPTIVSDIDGILLINKPAGWLVHPAGGTPAPDLVSWLREQGVATPCPVHRIDLETSGVVLFGRTGEAAGRLGAMFARGEVQKRYLALVAGRTNLKGIIRKPLEDARRGVALEAITRWRLVESLGGFSLLSVRPEHGRKHQIRRHLTMIGHPVVGDTRWGPRRPVRCPGFPGRLWLHAERVELSDGTVFEVPLDPILEQHLVLLRSTSRAAKPDGDDVPTA